jgi:hypothetical protein
MNNQTFTNLINTFFDVYQEYRNVLLSINIDIPPSMSENEFRKIIQQNTIPNLNYKQNIHFEKINDSQLKNFYKKINIFYNHLYKIKNNHILIHGFIDNQYNLLVKIKFFLVELKKMKARSFHDKIFINILGMNKRVPLGITRTFNEFIKGITYFKNEIENKNNIPIYHRAASCGNSNSHFRRQYLKCYSTNLPEDINIKKQHIFKCYLERMIYDKMYKELTCHFQQQAFHVNLEQNEGHRFQLSERANNFNSCFLGIKININMVFENLFPTILELEYIENGNIIKKEIYEKIINIDEYGNTYYLNNVYYISEEDGHFVEGIFTYENGFEHF